MSNLENAQKAIKLAEKHEGDNDSAKLARRDAQSLVDQGRYTAAINRAASSIAHSIGVFSESYAQCRALLDQKV